MRARADTLVPAAAQGARLIAIDIDDDRLALAMSFAAQDAIDPQQIDTTTVLRGLTQGRVVETSGS